MTAILYVVNDHAVERAGGKYFVRHIDGEVYITRLHWWCDFIIKFEPGDPPTYLKNRASDREYHSRKEMSWMLLKAKEYGTIKTN